VPPPLARGPPPRARPRPSPPPPCSPTTASTATTWAIRKPSSHGCSPASWPPAYRASTASAGASSTSRALSSAVVRARPTWNGTSSCVPPRAPGPDEAQPRASAGLVVRGLLRFAEQPLAHALVLPQLVLHVPVLALFVALGARLVDDLELRQHEHHV